MGAATSAKRQTRFLAATKTPEDRIDKFASKLDISSDDVFKIFKIFDRMDVDHSTEISLQEFFLEFDLDFTSFGKNIFAAIDTSGDNNIEFVVR